MMDFRIDTFLTVCTYMNFTRAAKALNITQPAVSQHIHYLEAFYNVKLFTYEGKKMYLTNAGDILYQAAITMKHDDLYLKETINDLSKRKSRLIFGTTLTIGEFVMAKHIKSYLSLYPDTELRMTVGNTSELLKMLRMGEIDFALVEGNYAKEEYDYLVYSQERYIPVCSKDYTFEREPKKLTDLLSERIIIRERGSGTREILEKNLEYRNLEISDFRYRVEIGGINAIKSLVESSCGITFLYEVAVKEELEKGILREIKLKDFKVSHDFAFIWNKGSIFSKNYREICEILRN
ncbi:LysR family transcriptional regulator [Clostridium sp. CS001]|uniref:LysR family transcriptional regulator n=1 Tax=Clostridium sp. CS001 TaxID=2880648 RepID=UPI001CF40C6A|nr:LysR family transcriptional regulator [Clostridium sp. CS001]MCB2289917.1 LysR family transcriptional regulator [Clostridium sp. CS001]